MGRALLSKRLPDADAIRIFAEHHITQVRRRRNGEIVAVKHCTVGWISPRTYYVMQEIHRLLPEFIRGGYQAKAWLWSFQFSILGESIPVGGFIPGYAMSKVALSIVEQRPADAALWLAALVLPWGDLFIIEQMLADTIGVTLALDQTLNAIGELWRKIVILPPILPPINFGF